MMVCSAKLCSARFFFFFFFFALVMHVIRDSVSLATCLFFFPSQCSTALFIPYFVHGMYIRYYYMVIHTRLLSL